MKALLKRSVHLTAVVTLFIVPYFALLGTPRVHAQGVQPYDCAHQEAFGAIPPLTADLYYDSCYNKIYGDVSMVYPPYMKPTLTAQLWEDTPSHHQINSGSCNNCGLASTPLFTPQCGAKYFTAGTDSSGDKVNTGDFQLC